MKKLLLSLFFLATTALVHANDIQLANTSLSGQNTTAHTVLINFDVTWKNSWRTSTNEANYDGAWIFVKYRKLNTSNWQHCTLNTAGFTAPSGSTIKVSADQKGLWIYRSSNGIGDVNYTGGKVVWNYGSNGVLDTDSCEIRVYAVEMAYVPQGSFYLGSGGTEYYGFTDSTSSSPYQITSENALNYGTTNGQIYSSAAGAGYTIPANFPKGYAAFWCMKYECSQQQYADFLNSLDLLRSNANNPGIFSGTHPNLIAPNPERAMSNVGTGSLMAWMDWAAMRPMSEMEYEKACRGANITPIPNEYAWGSTSATGITTINNAGTPTESFNAAANVNANSGVNRMVRCGGFATDLTASNREASGATYYGIMEMTGNGWERVIRLVNTPTVLLFNRTTHGDGNLAATGASDVTIWMDLVNNTYTNVGLRGSGYANATTSFYCTSDRYYCLNGFTDAAANFTFRAVRTGE